MNMWTRSELKERGKAALHRNYWIVVLVTLVVTALTGGTGNAAGLEAVVFMRRTVNIRQGSH